MPRTERVSPVDTLAINVAGCLQTTIPASVDDLCRDLACTAKQLHRAVKALATMGVSTHLSDYGYTVHRTDFRQCQRVAAMADE